MPAVSNTSIVVTDAEQNETKAVESAQVKLIVIIIQLNTDLIIFTETNKSCGSPTCSSSPTVFPGSTR